MILTNGPALHVSADLPPAGPEESPPTTLSQNEREYILKVLRETKGVLSGDDGAATRLGMKRTTLQSRMKKLGITRDLY